MSKIEKFLLKLMTGRSDANILFSELCNILNYLGFEERINGDHHIFTRNDVEEILNLQPKSGKAKIYQVKQIRNIFLKYKIGDNKHE
ncbi:MAG: type II toxin-antitoxin system HicA family toxin [Desulfamplus sp.]|nr:type II toxin-antitoxin system HicA family toxin [Desulfamplus sp.]